MVKITSKIKAIILDLDGVITDTAEYHYRAWKRLADDEGIPFTREDNEKLRGVSRRKSLEFLLNGREVPEEKMQEMMERKNRYYQEFITQITPGDLLPGAGDLLKKAKEKGLKLAVASASKNARTVIQNLGIEKIFDTISDGYSVEKTKPAPDLFLHTAEKLQVAPETCVVVEDAEAGIEAALAANMVAVGIGPKERVGRAHFRYDTVADIDFQVVTEDC